MEIKEQITAWKEALLSPNQNDVLVNLEAGKNAFELEGYLESEQTLILPQDALLNKIVKKHKESIKESGTPIFGVGNLLISFELENKSYACPVFVAGCSVKKNRFNKTYEIGLSEDYYLNPFLIKTLELSPYLNDEADLEMALNETGLEYKVSGGSWLANFHPHRFILLKELELLNEEEKLSPGLQQLLGFNEEHDLELGLHEGLLFDSDEDQSEVFKKVQLENLVIQGPPGTGKSQVIGNLLGKVLGTNKNGMLVAEKRVALEVIYEKLKSHNLHHFCLLYHHELKTKDFISSLQETWKLLEDNKICSTGFDNHSKLEMSGLSLTLERLKQPDLIGGISFSEFLSTMPVNTKSSKSYLANVPDIPKWEKEKQQLTILHKENEFEIQGSWLNVKFKNEPDFLRKLESGVLETLRDLKKLEKENISLNELEEEMRKSSLAALFFYDDLLIPPAIFKPNHKDQKSFLELMNRLVSLEERFELLKSEKEHWTKNFSLSELEDYMAVLASTNRYNIRTWLQRKKLMQFTDLNLNDAKSAIQNLAECKKTEREIIQVREEIRKLGVSTDKNELAHIQYVIRKTNQTDKNLVKSLTKLSASELNLLKSHSTLLNKSINFIHRFMQLENDTDLFPVLKKVHDDLSIFSEHFSSLVQISSPTKQVLKVTSSLEEANELVYHSHWKSFTGLFPALATLDGKLLKDRIDSIVNKQRKEFDEFSAFITNRIRSRFEEYHELLQTPARKLNQEEKDFKKELRKGKSILVKAFGKTRNFPSIRELLGSEAAPWVKLLHPVFLCSPYSVARSLPPDVQYDLVIFDEASQIPLPHALGSVQRAKRIVVAGDQQQMAPQFYFQKKSTLSSDLLHQSSFYWKNCMLTNHYRSVHSELITFSNRYFYQNKLKTYPTPEKKNAIELIQTDGTFIDRKNTKEAQIATGLIEKELRKGKRDFGLVAFSQTQLKEIIDRLSPETRAEFLDDESNTLIQSLENVQGDQCEHLIISMAYAPNENGEFHMRFGPLNQEQGHRRLNVLMSRARSKITFIRSVTSADFNISDNDGVELLRKLMMFLEEERGEEKMKFPYNLTPEINEDRLIIRNPQAFFSSAEALVNFHKVMEGRGWIVEYVV